MVIPSPIAILGHLNRFKDIARSNRFFVTINGPINNINGTLSLMMQCESAEIPGKGFNIFEAKTSGPNIKFPYQMQYNDLVLGFYCVSSSVLSLNTGLPEKRYFDTWISTINPKLASFETGIPTNYGHKFLYKSQYASQILIQHIDVDGLPTYTARVNDAFPININAIPINWASDELMRMTVTFAYTDWELVTI